MPPSHIVFGYRLNSTDPNDRKELQLLNRKLEAMLSRFPVTYLPVDDVFHIAVSAERARTLWRSLAGQLGETDGKVKDRLGWFAVLASERGYEFATR